MMFFENANRKHCLGGTAGLLAVLLLAVALSAQETHRGTNQASDNDGDVVWNSTQGPRVAHNDLNSLPVPKSDASTTDTAVDLTIVESAAETPETPFAWQEETRNRKENFADLELPAPPTVDLPKPNRDDSVLPLPNARYYQPVPENQASSKVPVVNEAAPSAPLRPVVQNAGSRSSQNVAKSKLAGAKSPSQIPSQIGTTDFILAAQPKPGERPFYEVPQTDPVASLVPPEIHDFSPTPINPVPYDAGSEMHIYEGKYLNANRRPLVELGRPWYQLGQLKPGNTWLGSHNLVSNQFLIYGDYRMAYAHAKNFDRDYTSQVAFELNLNFNWQITATERLTAFVAPLDNNNRNTRWLLDEDRIVDETNFNFLFGFFEGDVGALVGGMCGQTLPFDLPFAVGVLPMVVQNGVWMEDAITGVAATIPARHCVPLDISNMDITFFAGFDDIDSPAFEGNKSAARLFGAMTFIEACGGYWEIDYAFLDDRDRARVRSYHNIGLSFTRRYGRFISNSVRVIGNAGQATINGPNTADGVIFLIENSLITSQPSSFVPYLNFWAGLDRPQSAARAGQAGGILRNTGILFETDGMTAFPTLDDTGNNTWGGAFGLNILTPNFDQQLILEFAFLQAFGDAATRNAPGNQAGLGARYQIPLSNAWILRSDVMYGFLDNTPDIHGARVELRHKF